MFGLCAEAQNETAVKASISRGVYRYIPRLATPDEDYYIVIKNPFKGRFYCTSDLIEIGSREGYRPGFFVANMHEMKVIGDSLYFSITVHDSDYFTKPFPLCLWSSSAVRKQGGKHWNTGSTFDIDNKPIVCKKFTAKVSSDSIVFDVSYLNAISAGKMTFIKEKNTTVRTKGALKK
jgi:hypothetical protein